MPGGWQGEKQYFTWYEADQRLKWGSAKQILAEVTENRPDLKAGVLGSLKNERQQLGFRNEDVTKFTKKRNRTFNSKINQSMIMECFKFTCTRTYHEATPLHLTIPSHRFDYRPVKIIFASQLEWPAKLELRAH
eukprot:2297479-Amphidinium_carterae.2